MEPTSQFPGEAPSQKRRLVAGCPDATEPAELPAEGTTEEPGIIVESVASYPIIICLQADEFVSEDVMGE